MNCFWGGEESHPTAILLRRTGRWGTRFVWSASRAERGLKDVILNEVKDLRGGKVKVWDVEILRFAQNDNRQRLHSVRAAYSKTR